MDIVNVRMAEMAYGEAGQQLKATLGSCVGLVLRDGESRRAALAHIMLPTHYKTDTAVGKYADTAIPALITEIVRRGSKIEDLQAYVTGGAHMFAESEDAALVSVGQQNITAVRAALDLFQIPIVFEETGGNRGRTVRFDCATAAIEVRTIARLVATRSTQ